MGKTIILILIAVSLIGASLSVPLLNAGAEAGFQSVGLRGCNNAANRGANGGPPPGGPPGAGGPPPPGASPPPGGRPSGPPPTTPASSG